ncbi:MAG: cupin [bacterium]|nr:cupin [bacterium]
MKVVDKPWGREIWWAVTARYVGKIIEVKAGHRLSLQYHQIKLESMYCVSGQGAVQIGSQFVDVGPGWAATILPGTLHRVTAVTDLVLHEVSTPEVTDVVRLNDDYDRMQDAST